LAGSLTAIFAAQPQQIAMKCFHLVRFGFLFRSIESVEYFFPRRKELFPALRRKLDL